MATVVRRPFTDQYLLEYSSNHVYYEIDHFLWLAEKLDKQILIGAASPEDVTKVNNVLIEGFGLHLRNVIDFLYPRGSVRPDDIISADFFAPGSWDALKPAPLSDSPGRSPNSLRQRNGPSYNSADNRHSSRKTMGLFRNSLRAKANSSTHV